MKQETYIKRVNELIPTAVNMANKRIRADRIRKCKSPYETRKASHEDCEEYRHCFWTEYFHNAMKILTIQNKLRTY